MILALEIARSKCLHFIWVEADSYYVENVFIRRDAEVLGRLRARWLRVLEFSKNMQMCFVTHVFREEIK